MNPEKLASVTIDLTKYSRVSHAQVLWQHLFNYYNATGADLADLSNLRVDYANCKEVIDTGGEFLWACYPNKASTVWMYPPDWFEDSAEATSSLHCFKFSVHGVVSDNTIKLTVIKMPVQPPDTEQRLLPLEKPLMINAIACRLKYEAEAAVLQNKQYVAIPTSELEWFVSLLRVSAEFVAAWSPNYTQELAGCNAELVKTLTLSKLVNTIKSDINIKR